MEEIKKIETKDLILAKATMADLESIYHNYWCSEKTAKYMFWVPQKNIEEARDRLERTIEYQKNNFAFLVYEKSSGQAIGQTGMKEISPNVYEDSGIGIGEKFVGRGYGKQILKAMIDCLFEKCNAEKIVCTCHTDNIPSAKMQQACGLKYSHSEIVTRPKDGLVYKSDFYEITKQEWQTKKYINANAR